MLGTWTLPRAPLLPEYFCTKLWRMRYANWLARAEAVDSYGNVRRKGRVSQMLD